MSILTQTTYSWAKITEPSFQAAERWPCEAVQGISSKCGESIVWCAPHMLPEEAFWAPLTSLSCAWRSASHARSGCFRKYAVEGFQARPNCAHQTATHCSLPKKAYSTHPSGYCTDVLVMRGYICIAGFQAKSNCTAHQASQPSPRHAVLEDSICVYARLGDHHTHMSETCF